jgi:hypothetical protein
LIPAVKNGFSWLCGGLASLVCFGVKIMKDFKIPVPLLNSPVLLVSSSMQISAAIVIGVFFLLATSTYKVTRQHRVEICEGTEEIREVDEDVDLRRQSDKAFELSMPQQTVDYVETVTDFVTYGHSFLGFELTRVHKEVYETSDDRKADLELLTQMTSPRSTQMTISPEALMERMATSTSNGPEVNYDRSSIFGQDVNGNTSRLATAMILSDRCRNIPSCVYESVFRTRDVLRLVRNPEN